LRGKAGGVGLEWRPGSQAKGRNPRGGLTEQGKGALHGGGEKAHSKKGSMPSSGLFIGESVKGTLEEAAEQKEQKLEEGLLLSFLNP